MKGSGSTHDPYNIRITTQLARAVCRQQPWRARRRIVVAVTTVTPRPRALVTFRYRYRAQPDAAAAAADDDDDYNYYDVVIVPKTTYPRGVRHSRIVDIHV